MNRVFTFAVLALLGLGQLLMAQETQDEPGGLLVDLLQDSLSGNNRYIRVVGLEGALSSSATIKTITVSDDEGVWLTVSGAKLDWNRLALLRGNFVVNTLRADQITIDRQPNPTATDDTLPTPEAQGFKLPELPVAIRIGEIAVDELNLAPALVGVGADLKVAGRLVLEAGKLDSQLSIARLDRQSDQLDLNAQFTNATDTLAVDLTLTEAANGLLSELLSIPDRPALVFSAKGQGPVTDFAAEIRLAVDQVENLSGQVFIRQASGPERPGQHPQAIFGADLTGDLRPLMVERYHPFFGASSQLELTGRAQENGAVTIDLFDLKTKALSLTGDLAIAASGALDRLALTGTIKQGDGQPVILPIAGPQTTLHSADIAALFNASTGSDWQADITVRDFNRPEVSLAQAKVAANGRLIQDGQTSLSGQLLADVSDLEMADLSLNTAIGPTLALDGAFEWSTDQSLRLSSVNLRGQTYSGSVDANISGLDSGLEIDGSARLQASDISRFSALADRRLSGSITAQMTGKVAPLAGTFDVVADVTARNLTVDITQIDALSDGDTQLTLDAARDGSGTLLRKFQLQNAALDVTADGVVRSSGATLDLNATLTDIARLAPRLSGQVSMKGALLQTGRTVSLNTTVTGPKASKLNATAAIVGGKKIDLTFDGAVTVLDRFVPQLTGIVDVAGSAQRSSNALWQVQARTNGSAGLAGNFNASFDETDATAGVTFDASLNRIERFVPDIAGTVLAKGRANMNGTVWTVEADANGPGGISAVLAGGFDQATNRADMTARGQAQLGLANTFISPNSINGLANFDIALRGPLALSSVSGSLTSNGAVVALPALAQTVRNIDAAVTLSNANAQLNVTGAPRDGGTFRVSGPLGLSAPYTAALDVGLNGIVLTDNISYTSSANGQLQFRGPLTGGGTLSGRVDFGETEINIAAVSGAIGAAPIPDITHIAEPATVRATRSRAGLLETANGGSGPVIGLNVALNAPRQVFARGRGLNAEMGGNILVRGTTARVIPSGQISLIRGTFDLLGRRLSLDEGRVSLQGKLEPYLQFLATTDTSEGQATLTIAGPMTAPEIEVSSEPERPSEEALAMLLFGDKFTNLSPLKIAQLAAQLATLGGSGGGVSGSVRENLGVDVLDVGTDTEGNAQVGVGSYLSDDVYTDVTINSEGQSEINLNLDVTDNLTLKGSVDNTGETGVGLFYQRDY